MKQEMFFVVKRNSLTSKMEENGLMTKLFPLHFSHRGKNTFYNVLIYNVEKDKNRINLTSVFEKDFFVKTLN